MAPVTKETLRAELEAKKDRIEEIDRDSEGERFDDVTRTEYNDLNAAVDELNEHIRELEARDDRLRALAEDDTNVEKIEGFQTSRPRSVRGDDIWDFSTITRDYDNPQREVRQLYDRAKRAIERADFPHPVLNREDSQAHLERLMRSADTKGDGHVAKLMLATGSEEYKQAFTKYASGQSRTDAEQVLLDRAMSLTSASGGAAVPFVLDPTLLPSYSGAVNPYRSIADVRAISVDEFRGVTSAGITAAFQAEASATTDQSPTLASVSISTEMARVTIPYSIEIGMDWSSFATDMAQEIQNSKDVLEATKFAIGSGTNEPFGVITGATTVFTSSSTNVLFVADIYGVHDALGPLYRSRANWTFNNAVLSKIRQLDTAGGSSMLTPNIQLPSASNVGSTSTPDMTDGRANVDIFGKGVYEASGQSGTFTTGQLIGVIGAFNPYFKIIDRVGLTIVDAGYAQDATSGFPTGQKLMFAYWRVGSKVMAANAFRTLKLA